MFIIKKWNITYFWVLMVFLSTVVTTVVTTVELENEVYDPVEVEIAMSIIAPYLLPRRSTISHCTEGC